MLRFFEAIKEKRRRGYSLGCVHGKDGRREDENEK